jgi:hypothetical protein
MSHRARWVLALAVAFLIGAAVYVSGARRAEQPPGVGELIYPGLESQLDDVKAVVIRGPGAATLVTVKRAETGWQVAERSGFPADTGRVRTLLLGLAQARMIEEKSSLPANYPSLGVEDLSAAGATGTGVELEGLPKPVSLIVGKSPDGRSSFVRRMGEAASWQVGTALTVERDPAKWLATELLDIGADRIQSAEVAIAGKRPWSAAKASRADQSFTVTGKSSSGKPAATGDADRVATALAGLRLSDVRRAADTAGKPAATATYRTFDGLVLAIEGYTEGDKRYIRVRPSVDEAAAQKFFVAPASPAGKEAAAATEPSPVEPSTTAKTPAGAPAAAGKPAEAKTPESVLAQTRAEAAKLASRLEGWSFEIPTWSYDALFAQ